MKPSSFDLFCLDLHDAENRMLKFKILWILQDLENCRFGARKVSFFLLSYVGGGSPRIIFFYIGARSMKFGVLIPYDVPYVCCKSRADIPNSFGNKEFYVPKKWSTQLWQNMSCFIGF